MKTTASLALATTVLAKKPHKKMNKDEDCCRALDTFHTQEPTKEWFCGAFRDHVNHAVNTCKNSEATLDASYNLSAELEKDNFGGCRNKNFNKEKAEDQMGKWFKYFCDGEELDKQLAKQHRRRQNRSRSRKSNKSRGKSWKSTKTWSWKSGRSGKGKSRGKSWTSHKTWSWKKTNKSRGKSVKSRGKSWKSHKTWSWKSGGKSRGKSWKSHKTWSWKKTNKSRGKSVKSRGKSWKSHKTWSWKSGGKSRGKSWKSHKTWSWKSGKKTNKSRGKSWKSHKTWSWKSGSNKSRGKSWKSHKTWSWKKTNKSRGKSWKSHKTWSWKSGSNKSRGKSWKSHKTWSWKSGKKTNKSRAKSWKSHKTWSWKSGSNKSRGKSWKSHKTWSWKSGKKTNKSRGKSWKSHKTWSWKSGGKSRGKSWKSHKTWSWKSGKSGKGKSRGKSWKSHKTWSWKSGSNKSRGKSWKSHKTWSWKSGKKTNKSRGKSWKSHKTWSWKSGSNKSRGKSWKSHKTWSWKSGKKTNKSRGKSWKSHKTWSWKSGGKSNKSRGKSWKTNKTWSWKSGKKTNKSRGKSWKSHKTWSWKSGKKTNKSGGKSGGKVRNNSWKTGKTWKTNKTWTWDDQPQKQNNQSAKTWKTHKTWTYTDGGASDVKEAQVFAQVSGKGHGTRGGKGARGGSSQKSNRSGKGGRRGGCTRAKPDEHKIDAPEFDDVYNNVIVTLRKYWNSCAKDLEFTKDYLEMAGISTHKAEEQVKSVTIEFEKVEKEIDPVRLEQHHFNKIHLTTAEYQVALKQLEDAQKTIDEFYKLPVKIPDSHQGEVTTGLGYGIGVVGTIIDEAEGQNELGIDGQTTVTEESLATAKENIKNAHKLIMQDIQTCIDLNQLNPVLKEEVTKFKVKITHELVEKSEHHSAFCHFNFFHHRVRNNEVITSNKLDTIENNCKTSLDQINRKLNRCKKPKQFQNRGQYISGMCGASEVNLSKTFGKWKVADDSLYDETLKTTKRRGCMKDQADNMRKDFIEIRKFGNELRTYWQTEVANGNAEAAGELAIVNEIFEDQDVQNGWKGCVNQLDNIVDLITPQVRND